MGDQIQQADGTTGLVWLKWTVYEAQEMYNLTVDTAHTYFVGDGQWLVHNECPRIVNKKYAGTTFHPANAALKQKYPDGVKFDTNGFPDFSPYSAADVKIQMAGDYAQDFAAANKAYGIPGNKPPQGYTWHHHQDMTTMQLVPVDLHNAVRHTGGMSLFKRLFGLP